MKSADSATSCIFHPQCLMMLINLTRPSGAGMSVGWLIWHTVSIFMHVISSPITNAYIVQHNATLPFWCIIEYADSTILMIYCIHCGHFLLLLLCVRTPLSIIMCGPKCLMKLEYLTLPSGTGMSVGWLLCIRVSIFVYVTLCFTN